MFFSDLKKWVVLAAIFLLGNFGSLIEVRAQETAKAEMEANTEANTLAQAVAGKKQLQLEEMSLIAEQHFNLGKEYYDAGNFDKALDEFKTVLDISSNHQQAQQYRLQCIQAIANGNKAIPIASVRTLQENKNQGATEAYRQGLEAYRQGDIELASRKFEIALSINPRYLPAKRMLQRILEREKETLDRDQDLLWAERSNTVKKSWLLTERANKLTGGVQSDGNIITTEKQKMIEACKQIIPEINFSQAHIRDVLQYLSKITGVNIILDERVFDAGFVASTKDEKETEEEEGSDAEKASPNALLSETITISLTNIPLIEALKYILKIKGLAHRVDDYAILVSTPEGIGDEAMETRYYHMSSGIGEFMEFKVNDSSTDAGGIKGGNSLGFAQDGNAPEEKITIKDVLVNSGVPFPTASNVFMDKRTGTLIVHNTPDNLAMVEKILSIIDKPPFQVNIQAKFVRISQNDLEELGFEWSLLTTTRVGSREGGADRVVLGPTSGTTISPDGDITNNEIGSGINVANALGGTSGTALLGAINSTANKTDLPNFIPGGGLFSMWGILTDPQFRLVVHALDKTGNADLLSAPSVTTVNNQQAQIELVDEIIYPGEYDLQPPTISSGTGSLSGPIITPGIAVPGDFKTRDVGVILNVTPSVGSDRKTITLTLIPEVSEKVGDTDYGTDFVTESVDRLTGARETRTQHLAILQPIFRTSNVSTTVIVNDGETIVLGGLIEEKKTVVHDKTPFLGDIPFIGRLFRHDINQSQKMNLMIFVTARLITASGEDLHITQTR
jgi:general secretion pathway protein D